MSLASTARRAVKPYIRSCPIFRRVKAPASVSIDASSVLLFATRAAPLRRSQGNGCSSIAAGRAALYRPMPCSRATQSLLTDAVEAAALHCCTPSQPTAKAAAAATNAPQR